MHRSIRLSTLLGTALWASQALAVVLSEINYHPRAGEEALEFVELSNDSTTPEDISGYAFVEGIDFVIPPGTVLPGRGVLVIGADAAALKAKHGIENAIGNFTGKLESSGERITLVNHAGIVVQSVRYRVRGKWPVAPAGTGHTLVLKSLHLDPKEPESWMQSPQLGGSPGLPNFGEAPPTVTDRVLVAAGEIWRYSKGTAAFSQPEDAWLKPGFGDTVWLEGPSGFGFGDNDDATVLADMAGGYTSVACRKKFTLTSNDLAGGEFFLGVDYDDGFCAFLNGVEVARANCSPAGPAPAWNEIATASHEAGNEELFPIARNLLVDGENVLAIAGFNFSLSSTDFSLIPRLIQRVTSGGGLSTEEVIVQRGEAWRFVKGTAPFSTPASAWRLSGFNDGTWLSGPSGFGYREIGPDVAAYEVPAGTVGNQDFGGALGMDFDVQDPITITRLGVFDSGSDGLNSTITARLFDRGSGGELRALAFSPQDPGELREGSRFKDLSSPIELPAGFLGTIVAEGYGAVEPNGNQGVGPLTLSTNDDSGSILFVGGGRFGANPGEFPASVDGGPANRYAAGTFEFHRTGASGGGVAAPPGAATLLDDMRGGYTSIACRKTFTLSGAQTEEGDYFLLVDYDDGFCAFINGTEVARANCGTPGSEPVWNGVASGSSPGGAERSFPVPQGLLVEGENVLAIAAYNDSLDGSSFLLSPRLVRRRQTPSANGPAPIVFNELFRGAAAGQGWVELHNVGPLPFDLSGHKLTEDPARANPYLFPPGTSVPPRGFLLVGEAESGLPLSAAELRLFLLGPEGLAVAASTFDRSPAPGTPAGTWSEARFPDGGELEWISHTPTPAQPNQVARTKDIVINEIFYNPPENRGGEFVELFNRGASSIDLSGFRFSDGINYSFGENVVLPPGGYLVLSEDPAAMLRTYGVAALGPYEGKLSNQGEALRLVDRDGNLVDEVRYFDGGRWSPWADGKGSSLELIDPSQDNSYASAWEESDETGKAPWEHLSFHVDAYVPAAESELHLYLVEQGECLVDDVSVRRAGGANLIPNPGFEASTSPWILAGTHVRSRRTTADSHSGAASLQVVATGKGDTLVNRIETDTTPALTPGPYDVDLWARWRRGSSLIVVHGQYSPGPFRVTPCFTCGVPEPNLSGNPLSAALRLTVPLKLGTPGAENSATGKLRQATGGTNLGPAIALVRQDPPLPGPNDPVRVTARIADPDGVSAAKVFFRTGGPGGAFNSVPLEDDGLHDDGLAGDGSFGATLPGFSAGTKVVFYIEAMDGKGASRRFPVEAPESTCLFIIQTHTQGRLESFHVVLDSLRTAELQSRPLHSNDLVEGTFVFDEEQIFHDIGMRYRGSPWGRPSLASYRVRFPEDNRFRHGLNAINVSKTGVAINEGAGMFLIGRNALPGRPSPVPEYHYARGWFNGAGVGVKGLMEPIDGDFLEKWQGEGANGPLLKANGRFVFNDGGGLTGQNGWEGASFIYRGEDPENYRGYLVQSTAKSEDVWEPLFPLTRALDATETPDAAFDRDIGKILDLDGFFRVLGSRMLVTDCDAFGINNGHNGYIAFNSLTGLWGMVPFDVECSFVSSGPNLLSSADPGITRLLSRPPSRRAYFRTLSQFLGGYWSAAAAGPYLDQVGLATGYSPAGIKGHIGAVASQARTAIQSFKAAPFRILTNSGRDLSVSGPAVDLEGEASIDVEQLLVSAGQAEPVPLSPLWTTPSRWKAQFDLAAERTKLDFFGFDGEGNLLGSASITVTTTLTPAITVTSLDPTSGPAAGDTRVTIRGSGFAAGLQVLFGAQEGASLTLKSPSEAEVLTPPAPSPFPPEGKVDVTVSLFAASIVLPGAFTYVPGEIFRRGDANGDGKADISDAITILGYLFLGSSGSVTCQKSADIDDGGKVDISDPIQLLNFLFLSGRAPAPPYGACGPDPTADSLECTSQAACGG
jgi:hypothetical protein